MKSRKPLRTQLQTSSLAAPPEITLEALAEDTVQALRLQLGSNWAGPHRQLPPSAYSRPSGPDGEPLGGLQGAWDAASDGRAVWRVAIRSPGARSVSVHFDGFDVDGEVWVHATGLPGTSHWVGPYSGRGLHGDGEFWSEPVFAEAATISYFPRGGAGAGGPLPFVVQEIAHVIGEAASLQPYPKFNLGPLAPRKLPEPNAEPRLATACRLRSCSSKGDGDLPVFRDIGEHGSRRRRPSSSHGRPLRRQLSRRSQHNLLLGL